jgi:aryl hydrocarbon receptor nuclear translocator
LRRKKKFFFRSSQTEFVSRHSSDGKFTFADQRLMHLLGYSPQELLGKPCFDFIHSEDRAHMKESFESVIKMKGQVMNFMYRFRAKNGEWLWLRTNAFAFLNPYTDDLEYVVCTNSTAKNGSAGSSAAVSALDAPVAPVAAPAPVNTSGSADYRHTPNSGLDYSLAAGPGRMYSTGPHLTPQQQQQQASAQQVYSYDPSPSPAGGYGSPGMVPGPRAGSVGKNSGTPTPPQSAVWTQPSVTVSSDGYHYSNLSPSRSPGLYRSSASGPTGPAPSMWQHWQGNGQATGLELGPPPPHHHHHHHHPQHHELGDMLSMLGGGATAAAVSAAVAHHPATAAVAGGFENIGSMFTGQFQ